VLDRRIEDIDPVEEYYIAETKEPRYDTLLAEEKFTETVKAGGGVVTETWQWLNIETMPWLYTEFVLPDIEDVDDYILVSSFLTEDSTDTWPPAAGKKAVRMKFLYDPTDGTGIYVNGHAQCVPVRLVALDSDSPVVKGETMHFTATVTGGGPFTFNWDFDSDGTVDLVVGPTADTTTYAEWTYDGDEETYTVTLKVMDECREYPAEGELEVHVGPCFCDHNGDGFRDLADIMLMVPHWNTQCGDPDYDDAYDMDDDCDIDLADIMACAAVWNTPCQ